MFESCLNKQAELEKTLICSNQEELYHKIIQLGKALPAYPEDHRVPAALVAGCQSQMYLHSTVENGLITFKIASDALISAGLGGILLSIYNGESPETVLKCPPTCLQKLNLSSLLSPSRASGLASIHLRMKQEALHSLMATKF